MKAVALKMIAIIVVSIQAGTLTLNTPVAKKINDVIDPIEKIEIVGEDTVENQTYETAVLNSDKPVVIEFYSTWCPPCQDMAPILDEYAKETEDVKVIKIEREKNLKLKEKLEIPSVPTILIIKDGEEIARESKEFDKEGLEEFVKTALEQANTQNAKK